MFAEGFEQWMRLSKNAALPIHDLNKTITDVLTHATQQQAAILSEHFAHLSDQFQRLSLISRPEEWFHLQRECLNENVSASMDYAQKILKTSTENMEKFTKLLTPVVAETIAAAKDTQKQGRGTSAEKEKTAR